MSVISMQLPLPSGEVGATAERLKTLTLPSPRRQGIWSNAKRADLPYADNDL